MKKNLILVGLSILAAACGGVQEQEEQADNALVLGLEEEPQPYTTCGVGLTVCKANYAAIRFDCSFTACGDCLGVRNMTICNPIPANSGFNACGAGAYTDGQHYVSGYFETGDCNPIDGSSRATATRYGKLPSAGGYYSPCHRCAAGDSVTPYDFADGYCDPMNPTVLMPNVKPICKKA